ncbi:MAG: TM0106 family RecB-like putative nuclease, partial [Oligoflexales bacterium]|nr:TM0106 family RecB-like putative nuclease [Oligoflexales bacterium]
MQKRNGKIVFSPSDIVQFHESPFATWAEKMALDDEKIASKRMVDEMVEVMRREGNIHEKNVMDHISANGKKLVTINRKMEADCAHKETLKYMEKGEEMIQQALLKSEQFEGYVDLLVREPSGPGMEDHHYIPLDVKIAYSPKTSAILQLCCYSEMLAGLQKKYPEKFAVMLKDKERRDFVLSHFYYYYLYLKDDFLKFCENVKEPPIPRVGEKHGEWDGLAQEILEKSDDLSQIAGIRRGQITQIKRLGITTLTQMANAPKDFLKKQMAKKTKDRSLAGKSKIRIGLETFERLREQAKLQVESKGRAIPEVIILSHNDDSRPRGLALMPDESKHDIYFDMEGYPFIDKGGLEYLFGAAVECVMKTDKVDGAEILSKDKYISFMASAKDQEQSVFKNFIEWAYSRWESDPKMHIYHYGNYEQAALERLSIQHNICEDKVEELAKNGVFINLERMVCQALRIGTASYGLKDVENLYEFKRTTSITGAGEAMAAFSRWLDFPDSKDPQRSKILNAIRAYNRDDCLSTKNLVSYLRKLRDKKKIRFVDLSTINTDSGEDYRAKAREKRKEDANEEKKTILNDLEKKISGGRKSTTKKDAYDVAKILSSALEFHSREDRPKWRNYFEKRKQSIEEHFEDCDVFAGLKVLNEIRQDSSCKYGSILCQFEDQEIKIKEGDDVTILDWDRCNNTFKVKKIDFENGEVTLALNSNFWNKFAELKGSLLNMAIFSNIPKDHLESSLRTQANGFDLNKENYGLSKCVCDLILKKTPDIKDMKRGTCLIQEGQDIVDVLPELVEKMNNSVLGVQGPPGSGKTYLLKMTVLFLLAKKEKKKIAISSNSHKVIDKVLEEIAKEERKRNFIWKSPIIKIQSLYSGERNPKFPDIGIDYADDARDALKKMPIKLSSCIVGSTAFGLSAQDFKLEYFDYLLVDEATQVSLPNLIAMGRVAKNIVLFGDQMQLAQPLQAFHPEESIKSSLSHLSADKNTLTNDAGIFLPYTRRMQPSICRFISEMFYESKSVSDPEIENLIGTYLG